jgi:hypothetical protein
MNLSHQSIQPTQIQRWLVAAALAGGLALAAQSGIKNRFRTISRTL